MKPILYLVRDLPGATWQPLAPLLDIRGRRGAAPAPRAARRRPATRRGPGRQRTSTAVDAALVDALPALRHLASYGVGVNHLDLEAVAPRRPRHQHARRPDRRHGRSRDGAPARCRAAGGGGRPRGPRRRVDRGRSGLAARDRGHRQDLGIVGFGRIGQAVARRAAGFDLRVLYTGPRAVDFPGARRVDLDELLAQSDFVSLHVPLTPATRHLLSRERLARMRPGAVVVNTARGPVVDDAALAEALGPGSSRRRARRLPGRAARTRRLTCRARERRAHAAPRSGTRETRAAMARMALEDAAGSGGASRPWHPVA